MNLPLFHVDAFTERPFAGNPAAVCILHEPGNEVWMQQVAREMNLSETAFLYRQDQDYILRWFTPAVEVALCGHATLASAHILWEQGYLPAGAQARFQTQSGLLTAVRSNEWIDMDFPAKPEEPVKEIPGLAQALGVTPIYVGMSQFDCLVEVESEACVRALTPDFTRLAAIEVRGVIVTSRASAADYDFVSRFFAPGVGVPEDPVTGSAHCVLSPFWSKRLHSDRLTGYQASPRGGVVRVQLDGERVRLGGQAITVLRGELLS